MEKELKTKKINICLTEKEYQMFKETKRLSKRSISSLIRNTIYLYYVYFLIINKNSSLDS